MGLTWEGAFSREKRGEGKKQAFLHLARKRKEKKDFFPGKKRVHDQTMTNPAV